MRQPQKMITEYLTAHPWSGASEINDAHNDYLSWSLQSMWNAGKLLRVRGTRKVRTGRGFARRSVWLYALKPTAPPKPLTEEQRHALSCLERLSDDEAEAVIASWRGGR